MFERLFPRRPKEPKPLPQPDSQLALGALLMRIAFADKSLEQAEIAVVDRILAATFGLGPLDAAKLRAICTDLEMHAAHPEEFTQIVRDEVPYAERKALAHAMWQVLLADGVHDAAEETTLHDIETALGITPEDSAAAQTAALGSGANKNM